MTMAEVFMHSILKLLFIVFGLCIAVPAHADVTLTFYSHDFGKNFPHAFFTLKGQLDATGERVNTSYGFTAVTTSPAILMGPVIGAVQMPKPAYISSSNSHFSVRLNDAEYGKVMDLVAKWRAIPGKSYSLNKRNCVHFAMETAAVLGLTVNRKSKYFKKPRSFMNELLTLNPRFKK
jgi:hypothetical protein